MNIVILKKKLRTLPGDDAGDVDALGFRFIGELFEHHIRVQRPRKPLSNQF